MSPGTGRIACRTIDTTRLCVELAAVNADAAALCDGLSEEQLAWRTQPGKWSIAENLVHLRTTADVFLPVVDRALEETLRRGLRSPGPFRLGWYGRLLVAYVEPPPKIRLPAPRVLRPLLTGPPALVLDSFLDAQAAMRNRMEAAEGLDLAALRFRSPLAGFVRMNLLEFFSVFNGHSRRHIWQASRVRSAMAA